MAIEQAYGFIAENESLVLYNAQAVLDLAVEYEDEDEVAFTFPGYVSSFLIIWDSPERTYLVKEFTNQVSRNSNIQVINLSVSDMTFEGNKFYYELGYVQSGYDIVLRYGDLILK